MRILTNSQCQYVNGGVNHNDVVCIEESGGIGLVLGGAMGFGVGAVITKGLLDHPSLYHLAPVAMFGTLILSVSGAISGVFIGSMAGYWWAKTLKTNATR